MPSTIRIVALITGVLIGLGVTYAMPVDPWVRKAMLESADRMGALAQQPNEVAGWPPKVGLKFPEVALIDHTGAPFDFTNLTGKPTLVEIVAMSCAGCQAYSGGNKYGGYGGFPAQTDIQSIDEYFTRFTGGLKLDSNKINFVQIIIYNLRLEPAEPKQLEAWRQHFHFDEQANAQVLSGGAALANKASFNMIPGFLLLDKDQVVRYDATGHTPRHNLYTELLPAVRRMIN
jgi:hypothetical protein